MVAAIPKPKRPDNRARRFALNMKTTKELRDRLEERANATGRSFTLEVEQQLIKSFDLEEQIVLQDEIKAEMRGKIAALEARIALAQEWQNQLWPDESARILGKAFAMALSAARYAAGQDWREDRSAPLIVAGVVRRVMERYSRDSASAFADMFDGSRIAATADGIVQAMKGNLDKLMPALPSLRPQDDPALWTPRAYAAATFRDKATGKLLQIVRGPEFDVADPEAVRDLGPDHRVAVDRFRQIRDTIDDESFFVRVLKDGSTVWDSLSWRDRKMHVPAGQDAPPARAPETQPEEPAARLTGPEEAAALMAGTKPAPGQNPELFDRSLFDETMGDPHPDDDTPPPSPAEAPVPKPRRRAKALA